MVATHYNRWHYAMRENGRSSIPPSRAAGAHHESPQPRAGRGGLTTLYPGDVNLMAAVVKAWDEMSKEYLLGKAIWNIRTKKLLGSLRFRS
jgi:hypothetical protein